MTQVGDASEVPLRRLISAPHPDTAPLPPVAVVEDGVRVLWGVPYAELAGARPLELDLWLPPDTVHTAPAPLVLFLHGGGWFQGRRGDMGFHPRRWTPGAFARIAATGLAVACVDYRLSGEAVFPAQLEDVRTAWDWLALRSGELGIDTGRTVAWGESAGGHLAALLALGHPGSRPAAVVSWYAPADLTRARGHFDPGDPASPEARLLGAAPAADLARARDASPLAHAATATQAPPPFLLLHGTDDSLIPASHSEDLAAALYRADAEVELGLVPGAEHAWHGLTDAQVQGLFLRSLRFAHRALRG